MDGIQVEYGYAAPPELLWRALTERAKIAGWWGENDFVPELGHRFTVSAIGLAALAGPIQCTIIELDPQRRLMMGWQVGTTRATISLLLEADGAGSRLVVTRHGSVGPATPVDVEQALHHLFDVRLRSVLAPVGVGALAGSGSMPALGSAFGRPKGSRSWRDRPPRASRGTPPGEPRRRPSTPARVWPAVAIAVVVALVAVGVLLGTMGDGPDGSGSGTGLAPFDRPPGDAVPAVGPNAADPGGAVGDQGQTGQPGGNAQPNGPGAPTNPGPSTATTAQTAQGPPLAAHMSVGFQRTNLTLTAYRVTVTVTNSGNASGHWGVATVGLSGLSLRVTLPSPTTVSLTIRQGAYCFAPSSGTVPAGSSVAFSFNVDLLSGLTSNVTSVALDAAPCT
jgi:uncharacterized protein YndB with AHSA1/START domain